MKKGIEAVIKSVDEPQLQRCIEAVEDQTIPFDKVYHVNNVSPEYKAHNQALAQLEYEYVMVINGDTILDHTAVCKFWSLKKQYRRHRIWGFGFGLRDEFIDRVICCCTVYLSAHARKYDFQDVITNDSRAGLQMTRGGYKFLELFRQGVVIGSHFDVPDDFQIFHRFYARGVKCGNRKNERIHRTTAAFFKKKIMEGDIRYKTALIAFEKGFTEREYPTSHDIGFERKLYEETIGASNG